MSGDRSLVCAEGGAAVNNLDEGLDADVARLCQQAAMSWSRDSVDGGCWQPHHSKYSVIIIIDTL